MMMMMMIGMIIDDMAMHICKKTTEQTSCSRFIFLDKTRCKSVHIDVSEEVCVSIFMVVEKRRLGRSMIPPSAG